MADLRPTKEPSSFVRVGGFLAHLDEPGDWAHCLYINVLNLLTFMQLKIDSQKCVPHNAIYVLVASTSLTFALLLDLRQRILS